MPNSNPTRIDILVNRWRSDAEIDPNVAAWRTLPARPARLEAFPADLHPLLVESIHRRGISGLYSHQAEAWRLTLAHKHVVIVTGTASGKTLCYNLPVLDRLLRNPPARALYLFPTKALAQDQVENLRREPFPPSSFATYDGDTPASARAAIRANTHIIVSNPDMLHTGILPHHTLWADFFRNLHFVILDEMHAYRGVFGSHVANVVRRLKRVAAFYGATPQFILTSATIANPRELAGNLIEEEVVLVDDDGAAKGERHFVIYNPPVVNRALGMRRSALLESVKLAQDLLTHDIQSIVFARSRQSVEVLLRYLRPLNLTSQSPTSLSRHEEGREGISEAARDGSIRGYRSGYLPTQRREIERGLREGSVRAVVATTALELGIDIGELGAAVLVGYPGTIAATRQQAGRAGRASGASLAVLVTSADPLDQFLARHPQYIFDRSPEQALIHADNLLILLQHLRCAAFELPFQSGEGFGRVDRSRVAEFLQFLEQNGTLHRSGEKYFWMSDQYPADGVSLRNASADTVVLQIGASDDSGTGSVTIGQVDLESAFWIVHPKAIYLHEGQSYVVDELDLSEKTARMHATDADYYTEPRKETQVQLLDKTAEAEAMGATKAYGEIAVMSQVVGYKKVKWFTHENLGTGEVSLPPTELHTTGYWLTLNDETVEHLRAQGLWTNDPNDYGPNWQTIRDRIRARDRYRCQSCGSPEDGKAHHVHHKTPFRAFSSRELANQLDNLVTLCPNCHRRAEQAVALRSGLAGMAYALGHLAPFFLMCDTRDIGVHSDPASALADGRPAIVIYDSIPAGIGFSERLFDLHDELLTRAHELVASCDCEDGCPSCVGPGGENGYGGKKEARALLETLSEQNARSV